MRITLKNFRCWENKVFELNTQGIILLSGQSGKGKSSLLDAIYFCLYGNLKSVTTVGKTSCEVKIEYDNEIYVRSKRPNCLSVTYNDKDKKIVVEDDVAQEYLLKKFGKHFLHTSYIRQSSQDTFLYMTPLQKLEFLEECILKSAGLDDIKERIRENTKKLERDIVGFESRISTFKEILLNTPIPEKIQFPIKCSKSNIDKCIKNEHVRLKNFSVLYKRKQKEYEEWKDKYNLHTVNLQKMNMLMTEKEKKDSELSNMKSELIKYENSIGDSQEIKKYIDWLELNDERLKTKEEYESFQKKYEELLQIEESRIYSKIKELEDEYTETSEEVQTEWKEWEKNKKIKENVMKLKNVIGESHIDNYHKNIEEQSSLEKTIRESQSIISMSRGCYNCPECKVVLKFNGSNLTKLNINNDISDLTKKLEKDKDRLNILSKTISNQKIYLEAKTEYDKQSEYHYLIYEDVDKKIRELQERYKNSCRLENTLDELYEMYDNKTYPSVTSMCEIVNKLREKLERIDKENITLNPTKYDMPIQHAKEEYENSKKNEYWHSHYTDQISHRTKILNKITNDISDVESGICYESVKKTEDLSVELDKLREDIRLQNVLLDNIKKYEEDVKKQDKVKELETQVHDTNHSMDRSKTELLSITKLKEKITLAETISIAKFIEEINIHTSFYLEYFFEDPISVTIQTRKETKDKKNVKQQININITYKGVEMDLFSLSGGERDRVNLAFTLAMSELFDSPLLILDECISSLDYTNCKKVLQSIRDQYKGKMVVCVHHQADEELFDDVVTV